VYGRILLLDDGSPQARTAIPHAAAMATLDTSRVLMLRVSHAAGERAERLEAAAWSERVRPGAAAALGPQIEADPPLAEVAAALRDAEAHAVGTLVIRDDDVDSAVVTVARRLGCDLIVISTHGLSGIHRVVLGSVADHVVRHADVPALLSH